MPFKLGDDISILSDDRAFFRRARSRSRPRARKSNPNAVSSSQSVATTPAKSSFFSRRARSQSRPRARKTNAVPELERQRSRSQSRPRGRSTMPAAQAPPESQSVASSPAAKSVTSPSNFVRKRLPKFKRSEVDDVSVSDSLCSGVLRDFGLGSTLGSTGRMSMGSFKSKYTGRGSSVMSLGNTGRESSTMSMGGDSIGNTGRTNQSAPMPGGVEDFNLNYFKKGSNESSLSNSSAFQRQSLSTAGGPSMEDMSTLVSNSIAEDSMKREARKEKVKEKLDKYKRDQRQLKQSCAALEQQLAQTTEKLREVDSRAAFKIDSLESELRETRVGMERVAKQSTKEVVDQSECIKTLGKKLIRQAHVIKRQKKAVEQYKVQLEAMQEEMNMQDERDSARDEECQKLREEMERVREQKISMQNMLQENLEEMMDVKSETERDAKMVMELEFNLQQKDAMLDRVAREKGEKSVRIAALEDELEGKGREVDEVSEKLKEREIEVEAVKRELDMVTEEVEELRCKYAAWGTTGSPGREDPSSRSVSTGGVSDGRPSMTGRRQSSLLWGNKRGITEDMDPETFESELQAKDNTIQTLDETVKEHEETIKTLRSDMVKMSSTYKQDSYLKRKEIAKLKQMNAEYALKLRALEKAFKCVNSVDNMAAISSSQHGHTSHGVMGRSGMNASQHGSQHGKSVHSVNSAVSKEDKAAAVRARLGLAGLAPYEFPSQQDPKIVVDSNFFDEQASEDGRKGETPAES